MLHKSTFKLTCWAAMVAMGNVNFGYAITYYGISQESIIYILGYENSPYQDTIDGLINAVLPIGAAFGAFYSFKISHTLGFRKSFMICDCLGTITAILSLFMSYPSIFITRFVYGFITGINSSLDPQYIQQLSPISLSGIFGAFCQLGLLVGLTIAFILQWIFLKQVPSTYDSSIDYGLLGFNSWRVLFIFPVITSILRLMGFLFIYTDDLPKEYSKRGDLDKAEQTIKTIYKEQYCQGILNEFKIEEALHGSRHMSYSDLFNKRNIRRFIVGSSLSFLNQWCGINAINFYSGTMFNSISGGNYVWVNILTVMDGSVSILVCLMSGYIINRFGRRVMFLIGNGFCSISLIGLTVLYTLVDANPNLPDNIFLLYQSLIITLLFVFIIAYSMSLGPVFWVYISEILPPKGIGLVVLQNWISLALLAQFFPIVAKRSQVSVCFGMFAIVSTLGEIFIYYCVKETKTLTKAQIHDVFTPASMDTDQACTSLVVGSYSQPCE